MDLPGGPTKDEIMAISLYKLGLQKDDVFADIGCGTGKVSICAAPRVRKVYAIDRRKEAIECARAGSEQSGLTNIEFYHGEAGEVLSSKRDVDVAFVGGSRQLEDVLSLLKSLGTRTIVVNAVMLETVYTAVKTMQELGIFKEAVQAGISRSYPIGRGIMFKPLDPVYIIVGGV
jgi:precorrin-6Y C5,15-methyltransferase (decarboxylating), CbiT subunit